MLSTLDRRVRATAGETGHVAPNSKSSFVLRELRRDIVSGALKPNQRLSFGFLTGQYHVGVSPLREALCLLVGRGLVELESQRGFRVAAVSVQDLDDVIAVRGHIEIYALGLSIDRGDDAWRRRLRDATAQFTTVAAKVGDQRPIDEDWQIIHRSYHFALIGACNSPTVLEFCKQIYDRFDRYRRLSLPTQSFMAGPARDHHEITEAAIAGRREQAQDLLRRHITDIADVVAANFSPECAR
jgi:GntR family carbon starvation induced transcriptional regulator